MKKRIIIAGLFISLLFTTGCQLTREEVEVIPVKPADYEVISTNKNTNSEVVYYESDKEPIKEHVASILKEDDDKEETNFVFELVDAPIIGATSSYIDCEIEAYGVSNDATFEGSYELKMAETSRYISSATSLVTEEFKYDVDTAYYINEDGWVQYKNVNADAGNEWVSKKGYDPVLDAYEVICDLNYSRIKDAEQVGSTPQIIGKYNLNEYKSFITSLYKGFDVSSYNLSNTDVSVVETSFGDVEKMEFISENDSGYIKILISINASNNSKKIDLPF